MREAHPPPVEAAYRWGDGPGACEQPWERRAEAATEKNDPFLPLDRRIFSLLILLLFPPSFKKCKRK